MGRKEDVREAFSELLVLTRYIGYLDACFDSFYDTERNKGTQVAKDKLLLDIERFVRTIEGAFVTIRKAVNDGRQLTISSMRMFNPLSKLISSSNIDEAINYAIKLNATYTNDLSLLENFLIDLSKTIPAAKH